MSNSGPPCCQQRITMHLLLHNSGNNPFEQSMCAVPFDVTPCTTAIIFWALKDFLSKRNKKLFACSGDPDQLSGAETQELVTYVSCVLNFMQHLSLPVAENINFIVRYIVDTIFRTVAPRNCCPFVRHSDIDDYEKAVWLFVETLPCNKLSPYFASSNVQNLPDFKGMLEAYKVRLERIQTMQTVMPDDREISSIMTRQRLKQMLLEDAIQSAQNKKWVGPVLYFYLQYLGEKELKRGRQILAGVDMVEKKQQTYLHGCTSAQILLVANGGPYWDNQELAVDNDDDS